MPTVKELKKTIRDYKIVNCPSYSKLTKTDLEKLTTKLAVSNCVPVNVKFDAVLTIILPDIFVKVGAGVSKVTSSSKYYYGLVKLM